MKKRCSHRVELDIRSQPDMCSISEKYLSCNKRENIGTLGQVGCKVSNTEQVPQPLHRVRCLESDQNFIYRLEQHLAGGHQCLEEGHVCEAAGVRQCVEEGWQQEARGRRSVGMTRRVMRMRRVWHLRPQMRTWKGKGEGKEVLLQRSIGLRVAAVCDMGADNW